MLKEIEFYTQGTNGILHPAFFYAVKLVPLYMGIMVSIHLILGL